MSKVTITTCEFCGEQTTKKMKVIDGIVLYMNSDVIGRTVNGREDICESCLDEIRTEIVKAFDDVVEKLIVNRRKDKKK